MTGAPLAVDHRLCWPDRAGPAARQALRLMLMPERAAFEPVTRTLFVADVHLGKAAVFRARGLPVPQGTTTCTLERLSRAIERAEALRLVVLGDFLHARESHAPATLAALSAWRERHATLDCLIVEGNHDVHAGQVQDGLRMPTTLQPYETAGLVGVHAPPAVPHLPRLTLAGHVHPVVRLRSRFDSVRLPCFHLSRGVLTLPAFGEFTGGQPVHAAPNDTVYVVGHAVCPMPASRIKK